MVHRKLDPFALGMGKCEVFCRSTVTIFLLFDAEPVIYSVTGELDYWEIIACWAACWALFRIPSCMIFKDPTTLLHVTIKFFVLVVGVRGLEKDEKMRFSEMVLKNWTRYSKIN